MRRLAQPEVVTYAAAAAALSAALCLPRFLLWDKRVFPIWYLEAIALLGGFVLWAFVFAWHTEYTRRPVFTFHIKPAVFFVATLAGIVAALDAHFFLDPSVRILIPEEYPADFDHWAASTLFNLAFSQLILVFAPYAWLVRLFRNEKVAVGLTIAFGLLVWLLKIHSSPQPMPSLLFAELFAGRIVQCALMVWFYLRGGILLVWWVAFLIEARHLFGFHGP